MNEQHKKEIEELKQTPSKALSPEPIDPKYEKYSKMHTAGLPEGALRNAMVRDGIDQAEQDNVEGSGGFPREKPVNNQAGPQSCGDELSPDERFAKLL